MPDVQPEPTTGGSVPHNWGNALARRWAPDLPRPLTGGFLTCLYALRTLASADGFLRYARDGKGIALTDIVRACRSDERDVRTYLSAAIAAGVLATAGARRRGVAAVYVLLLSPRPNWAAAAAVVESSRRRKKGAEPAPWHEANAETDQPGSGHRALKSEEASSGHRAPFSPTPSSGHRAPVEFGAPRPDEFGAPRPHHPGINHELPHEMAGVGPQPEVARGREGHEMADDPSPPLRSVDGAHSGARPPRQRSSVPDGQMPLLMSVPAPHSPQEPPAAPGAGDPPIGAPRDGWRGLVARERPDAAAETFRDRWTGDHARYLPHPTGT
ncbi:hypothetical protein [Streptomyces phaeochromogenes]